MLDKNSGGHRQSERGGVLMESLRNLVTDNLRDYLHDGLGLNEFRPYEEACEIADVVFDVLGIGAEQQDRPI